MSWGDSMKKGGKDLEWMRMADRMWAEQNGTRAFVSESKLDRDAKARKMWDIKVKAGEEWFHTTRKDFRATQA